MANLSEILVGQGFAQAEEGIKPAVDLGMKIEQTQRARQELEIRKQNAEVQAQNAALNLMKNGLKLPAQAQKSYFNKMIPKQLEKMGIPFDSDALNLMATDPEALGKFIEGGQGYLDALRNGQEPTIDQINAVSALSSVEGASNFLSQASTVQTDEAKISAQNLRAQKQRALTRTENEKKAQAKVTRETQVDAQKLGKMIVDKGLPGIESDFVNIEKALGKSIEEFGEGDIEGVGELFQNFTSNRNRSQKGQAIRQSALGLLNKVLKSRSGTAVTESEYQRIAGELGMTLTPDEGGFTAIFSTPKDPKRFVQGMKDLLKAYKAEAKEVASGFSPAARAQYRRQRQNRGGKILGAALAPTKKETAEKIRALIEAGKTDQVRKSLKRSGKSEEAINKIINAFGGK